MSETLFGIKKGLFLQQVNCQDAIGGGISGAIGSAFPRTISEYHQMCNEKSPEELFGKYQIVECTNDLAVANLFTQFDYGNPQKTGKIYTDKEKLIENIKKLSTAYNDSTVYIPYNIGCGLGGENWFDVIGEIADLNKGNISIAYTLEPNKFLTPIQAFYEEYEIWQTKCKDRLNEQLNEVIGEFPSSLAKVMEEADLFELFDYETRNVRIENVDYKELSTMWQDAYKHIDNLEPNEIFSDIVNIPFYKNKWEKQKALNLEKPNNEEKTKETEIPKEVIKENVSSENQGLTACFTGRRPKDLYGYDNSKYQTLNDKLYKVIEEAYKSGVRTFISGMAQGIDQLAFSAVEQLKKDYKDDSIKNIAYVPYKGQEDKWLETGMFSKSAYRRLLESADEVKYIYENVDPVKYAKQLNDRNIAMVDNSDLVIAVFPSDIDYKTTQRSGTANCMNYADSQNKPIIQMGYSDALMKEHRSPMYEVIDRNNILDKDFTNDDYIGLTNAELLRSVARNKENIRDMIEGELNRISVTDDNKEAENMVKYLSANIKEYERLSNQYRQLKEDEKNKKPLPLPSKLPIEKLEKLDVIDIPKEIENKNITKNKWQINRI